MTMGRCSLAIAVATLLCGCHLFRSDRDSCHKPQEYQRAASVAPLKVPAGTGCAQCGRCARHPGGRQCAAASRTPRPVPGRSAALQAGAAGQARCSGSGRGAGHGSGARR